MRLPRLWMLAALATGVLVIACDPYPKDPDPDGDDDGCLPGMDGEGCAEGGDGDGDGDGDFESCTDVLAAFEAEATAIRSCEMDEECGQVLTGTSCGCTRNWVARTDADTTVFYELMGIQIGGETCVQIGSTCDCPEADGYACVEGQCTWNYL